MTGRADLARCGRTAGIGAVVLDGGELASADRLHLAACAACGREAERIARFHQRLAATAATVIDSVPAPAAGHAPLGRLGRLLASSAVLAGAVAAGLLLAAVVGLRLAQPAGESTIPTLGTTASAMAGLAGMGLACAEAERETTCESRASDHVHRVVLATESGSVIGMEGSIAGTQGGPIDLAGADLLLGRMTRAVLGDAAEVTAATWLAGAYADCADVCAATRPGLRLTLEKRADGIILTVAAD